MKNSIEENIKILRESIIEEKYYIFNKDLKRAIENLLSDYKRVLKENKELKDFKKQVIEIESTNFIKYKNYISKHEVKDKIEKILNNKEYRIVFEGNAEFPDDATIINAQKYIKLEKMQELIEESEGK